MFSAELNEAEEGRGCTYHDGLLEINNDEGMWDEHDDEGSGHRDADSTRIEFPDMNRWTCCGLDGDGFPCQSGRHIRDTSKRLCQYARMQKLLTE